MIIGQAKKKRDAAADVIVQMFCWSVVMLLGASWLTFFLWAMIKLYNISWALVHPH